ncbi:MAG: mechanosensitive ion channel [Chlorobi bacterium]|nr:mechanosensitive ion channel [Chlorobiota bacterium]
MDTIIKWLSETLKISESVIEKLLLTLLVFVILWGIRRFVMGIVKQRTEDHKARYNWNKGTAYIVYVIGVLIVSRIWFEGVQSLATYLGLVSAGLAIALKDPITNVAGWLFIVWRRPFEVGDRVQIGEHSGDVIDIRIFQFTLLEIGNWVDADQSTGRIIHIPNGKIFTQDQANYSKAFTYIWDELSVLITLESNWRKAKKILQEIANSHDDLHENAREKLREASSRFLIFYNKLTPIVYTSVRDSGVMLQIRYLCEPRTRRFRKEKFWEAILDAFNNEPDLDLAYPTQRFYRLGEESEGKNKPDGARLP